MVSVAKMALLQSCGKLCVFSTYWSKKTYLDNPYYLIYYTEVIILIELLHNKNKGINLHAGVFSNFNTVLPQFYAQTYSNSIQIYHCKKYTGNKFILLSQHQIPVKKCVQRLKKNLDIEYKCIITIGRGGRVRNRVELVENPSEERFFEHCTNLSRDHFCENSASLLFHSSPRERGHKSTKCIKVL